jgi:diaminopimelate epimerase
MDVRQCSLRQRGKAPAAIFPHFENDATIWMTITTRGGDLGISWEGEGKPVLMTGPAVTVFEGELEIPHD